MRKPVLENKEALVPGTAKRLRVAKMCWAAEAGAAPQQPYRQTAGRAFLLLLQSKYTAMCVPLSTKGLSHFVKKLVIPMSFSATNTKCIFPREIVSLIHMFEGS